MRASICAVLPLYKVLLLLPASTASVTSSSGAPTTVLSVVTRSFQDLGKIRTASDVSATAINQGSPALVPSLRVKELACTRSAISDRLGYITAHFDTQKITQAALIPERYAPFGYFPSLRTESNSPAGRMPRKRQHLSCGRKTAERITESEYSCNLFAVKQ